MVPLKTSDFDYDLPRELIAQTPIEPRDRSRLLVLDRSASPLLAHRHFFELTDYLKPGDVMVFNNSRVIRARLFGTRLDTGQKIELLLLRRLSETGEWEALMRSKKRVEPGLQIRIEKKIPLNPPLKKGETDLPHISYTDRCCGTAEVRELRDGGIKVVRFEDESILPLAGEVPLPPYIHEPLADPERYQTVYAEKEGSAAAPTAGLHFTPGMLDRIRGMGVECLFVTLHVGLNTFRPVRVEDALQHPVFPEYGVVDQAASDRINLARSEGRRVICVGTTSVRLVESVARSTVHGRPLEAFAGWVNQFIYPGYEFRVMDALVTNFHLPKSTLLMLVSAFAGRDNVLKAYSEAIGQKYRFYSFGDAMLIL
jgi:S-adenosylmethionine:tRNA ribosyltransferase-isomerase